MSDNTIYLASTLLAFSGWVLLFVSVGLSAGISCLVARVIPALLAVVYTILMVTVLPFEGGSFRTLGDVASLFGRPEVALVGWVHYLAFDLFIGAWQVQTAHRMQLPNIVLVPALLLTMIFGPVGLLFFLAVQVLYRHNGKETHAAMVDRSQT